MYRISQAFKLFILITLVTPLCRAQYIPVAVLLEKQQEQFAQGVLDPILSELAVHIDQQNGPIVVSSQLVNRLIRHQLKFESQTQENTSDLFKLVALLKEVGGPKKSSRTLQLGHFYETYKLKRGTPHTPQESDTTESTPFSKISDLLAKKPYLVDHLFVSRIPLDKWHVYLVKDADQNRKPLYVLMPPSYAKTTHKKLIAPDNNTISLQRVHIPQLINAVYCTKKNDEYIPLKANMLASILRKIYASMPTQRKENRLIISLAGHGRYSRSPYGIKFSSLRPREYTDLPCSPRSISSSDPYGNIATLPISEFKKFLSICNDLPTALVYYDSCFTGNHHLVNPFRRKGEPLKLNYPVATRCIDGGVSFHEGRNLIYNPGNHAQISITSPINPRGFFQKCDQWCKSGQKEPHLHLLKHALLHMIGNKRKNHAMIRFVKEDTFTPIAAPNDTVITPDSISCMKGESIKLKKNHSNLFLGHNRIEPIIKGTLPMVRSIIPTNATHYIKKIHSTASGGLTSLEHISRMFFHRHNHHAVNRMIFFIKTLQLTSGKHKTNTLHDLFVLHHTPWAEEKNSFIIYRDAKDKEYTTYIATVNKGGRLADKSTLIETSSAISTILYYLKLRATDLSYIDAPPLKQAAPDAFDDTPIKEYCQHAFEKEDYTPKAIQTIWEKLEY